ncbi:MAG: T9SS type A sorting domain-containing protein, partial [Bacteroidota bacterium]|nr:T9SS type A sorting domain-containing protein [Bacteroidota bacterium]
YRIIPNFIRTRSIDFPPTDRYEMLNNSFKPQATVENWLDQDHIIEINYKVTNLVTGTTLYNRTDSFDVGNSSTRQDTASLYQGFPCGSYRLTVTSSVPSLGGDGWIPDNIMTRDFVYMKPDTGAMYDNFITLDPCQWHVDGATWVDATSVMYDPPSPRSTGALLLNRLDILGNPYLTATGSDTATTTPINLTGKSNVWLTFSYQRGLSTDNQEAGTKASVLVGPEPLDMDSLNQGVYQGDSLVVEALPDTAARYNPSAATWAKIATLYGTLDFQTKKFRMQLGSKYVHDHTRIRIRLMAKDDHLKYGIPTDDNDSWVIDNVQISAPTGGQTDLEPTNIDLGAGNFTHIPRNVKLINPKVTIGSNGLQSNGAVYVVHLVIQDNLNRFVYDKTQSLISPGPHTDVVVTMPIWDIQGSQGGKFTAKVTLAQNFNEYYRKNDTNTFIRSLYIDDVYALDDGVPDTVGTMTTAENNWFYYDFIPMANDSLRGIDAYHLSESGNTNWTINIMDTANHVLGTRACSYNAVTPKAPGFVRGTFTPFGLTGGTKYRLQCIMTQGFNLGGDASKSLMWESTHSFNSPAYTALHPDILSSYRNSANTDYLTAKKNASAGGPILPMVRFVFQGSATYLPVEVASFSGKRTDLGFVSLGFRTAKEEGVDHFDIDRESVSGWVNAGSIVAKNSRLGADYSLLDNQAPTTSLTYRLIEVDLDGSRRIAGTTTVGPFGSSEEFSAKVFPNPTTQNIHVMLSGVSEESSLVLFDALGKVVASKEHVKANTADLDASTLGAGFYWLEAHSGDHTARIKVVVSH